MVKYAGSLSETIVMTAIIGMLTYNVISSLSERPIHFRTYDNTTTNFEKKESNLEKITTQPTTQLQERGK